MSTERTMIELVCQLTQEEIAERAYDAGQVDQQIMAKEMAFDSIKKTQKAEIEELMGQRRTLLREIRNRQTERDVECEVHRIFHPEFVVRVIRLDTGEVVRERPMSMEERQGQLVGITGPKSEAIN